MPGYKQWADGDILTPSDVDGYLMGQTLMRFASAAARTSALPSPTAGMQSYLIDTGLEYIYSGGQWTPKFQFTKKALAETVTTNTTLQDDDDLVVALVPGTYRVELFMHAIATSLSGDVKVAWAFSGTLATQGRSCFGPSINTTDVSGTATAATTVGVVRSSAQTLTTAVSYGSDTSNTSAIHEDLFLEVTVAGTLKLQWAQVAASGNVQSTIGTRWYITRLA